MLFVLLPSVGGCKKGLKLVPVTGKVMYKNKELAGAYVNFAHDNKDFLAMAKANKSGDYRMRTRGRDGAVPGRHRVWITKFKPLVLPDNPDGDAGLTGENQDPDQPTQFDMQRMYIELSKKLANMPGKTVEDFKARAKAMQMPLPPSEIPLKYCDPDTSDLVVEVLEEGENHFVFTILDPVEDPNAAVNSKNPLDVNKGKKLKSGLRLDTTAD